MYYAVNKEDGYIFSVSSSNHSAGENTISEAEYLEIKNIIENMPTAPEGYGYRLKENLEWELYELPESPDIPEEATEADYREALERLGVNTYAEI